MGFHKQKKKKKRKNALQDDTHRQDSKDYFANWWTMLVTQPCQAIKKISTKQSRQSVYARGSISRTEERNAGMDSLCL